MTDELTDIIWELVNSIAAFSNCNDRQVGCVIITTTGDIVAIGYNVHQDGVCDCETTKTAQHAEKSAINNLPVGYNKEDLIAFINHAPCCDCTSLLSDTVSEVRYKDQKTRK